MSHWFIVHRGTDTVLALSECVLVDLDTAGIEIDGDDYVDDLAVIEVAKTAGVVLSVVGGVPGFRVDRESCDMCGSSDDVAGGVCSSCFESAPVGVWVSGGI